jgi:hypothetical protein
MALIRIKLNPAVDRSASIVLGDQGRVTNISHTIPIDKYPESSQYLGYWKNARSSDGILVITHWYQSFEEDSFKRWNFAILAQIADLIDKSKVIVELAGTPQTSTYVRTAHIVT